jgi:stress response protein SCP2
MEHLSRGQRLPLEKSQSGGTVKAGLSFQGLALDFACFAVDSQAKLVSESYMTFFNQPTSPCGGVAVASVDGDAHGFAFQLGRLPGSVDRVVITASIDASATMSQLQSGYLRLVGDAGEFARISFTGADFAAEKAVMLGEFYRKNGEWRFVAVGQGFDGGLDALVRHFGGEVSGDAGQSPTGQASGHPSSIALEKRVEREAPQLVSLVKSAGVSLAKVGLTQHRAKVCLVLDISGSMGTLYRKGLVQKFSERILALGCKFDDDGAIDVFLFGKYVHQGAPMDLSNWSRYVEGMTARHPLEADTRYGLAIEAVRRHYFPDVAGGERKEPFKAELPVYVMFVTDGTTSDKPLTERQLRWASREPIFWQFMGIGKGKKSKNKTLSMFADSDFPFLEKLDELDGRLIDNANFFAVSSPDEHSDSALYDLLMTEYPGWLKLAKQKGLLP